MMRKLSEPSQVEVPCRNKGKKHACLLALKSFQWRRSYKEYHSEVTMVRRCLRISES